MNETGPALVSRPFFWAMHLQARPTIVA